MLLGDVEVQGVDYLFGFGEYFYLLVVDWVVGEVLFVGLGLVVFFVVVVDIQGDVVEFFFVEYLYVIDVFVEVVWCVDCGIGEQVLVV